MRFIEILIATAALIFTCCSSSPVGSDTTLKLNLEVPFNDLLPPLVDSNATTTTTEVPAKTSLKTTKSPTISLAKTTKEEKTTHSPPQLFKSTKKSHYKQQTEHIKELHLIDDDGLIPHDYSVQAEQLQHLHDEQDKEYKQQLAQQRLQKLQQQQSIKLQKQQKFQKTSAALKIAPSTPQHVASQPKKALPSSVVRTQTEHRTAIRPSSKPAAQTQVEPVQISTRQQQQVAPQITLHRQPLQQYRQQHRFQAPVQPLNFDTFQQYIDFQHTTHRPPKAGLPTLTPFPRHLK